MSEDQMQDLTSKRLALILSIFLILLLTACASQNSGDRQDSSERMDQAPDERVSDAEPDSSASYGQYSRYYKDMPRPHISQRIAATLGSVAEETDAQIVHSFPGAASDVLRTEGQGSVYWDVDIAEAGMYHLNFRYYSETGNGSLIERELRIDGQIPFAEAQRFVFSRVWGNASDKLVRDRMGNDLRPRQVQKPQWQEALLQDAEGYYKEPFSFYLSRGTHRIELVALREPLIIDYWELVQAEEPPSYTVLAATYAEKEYTAAKSLYIPFQGEAAIRKSSPSLYALNDRSSAGTEPYHISKIRMNSIGGVNWKVPGQWISWEVDIPEDGLYELGMRYKQNMVRGIQVVRKLYIDGKVPFAEAANLTFPYDGSWKVMMTGGDQPYLYRLTKGRHEIKLELTMGDLSEIIRDVRASIKELNDLYLKVIMITGVVPDPFRDYQLKNHIPNLAETFTAMSNRLNQSAYDLDAMVGGKSSSATILRTTAYQLQDLGRNPETITTRLSSFKENVSSLGTWLLTVNEQPLEIDYLFFKTVDQPAPKAATGMWTNLRHEVGSFVQSFFEDYNHVGEIEQHGGETAPTIRVWITSGRDQAQLIRSLINNSFAQETGIQVQFELVSPEVVLPVIMAGEPPDVALSMDNVINLAMRNSLEDLSQFSDFQTVKNRFMDSSFAGFAFRNGIYAVPETQVFPMLFYRKDILDQLGLEVPQTWDDLYYLIPELQKNNMNIAAPNLPVYEMMLYQQGGRYYEGDGIRAAIDSDIGMSVFRKWTELYTNYRLPIEFDFINRFRTGEMPIGIADYTTFNYLTVFAPEIRGQWDFALLPGMKTDNGEINRVAISTATGAVMFKDAKHKEAAWTFIKWWTDAQTQAEFGREMEAILGESARYPAANIEALQQLPWSAKEYGRLMEQLSWTVGKPLVPGSYMMDRHLLNAFYEVINNAAEPRETLENYVRIINEELTIKRKEFHLPTQ